MYLVGQNYNIDSRNISSLNFCSGATSVPMPSEVSLKPLLENDYVEFLPNYWGEKRSFLLLAT